MLQQRTVSETVVEFIRAFAQLLWPLVVLFALIIFKGDIRSLIARLRKGKILGQELELAEEAQKVEKQVEAAERAEPPKPVVDPAKGRSEQLRELEVADNKVRRFLEDAQRDKLLALVGLWIEIERELRNIVAANGFLQFIQRPGATEYVRVLRDRGMISQETEASILTFRDLRNRLVHGNLKESYAEPELVALLDSGLRLLELLRAIPRATYTVSAVVPFYSDSAASVRVEGAWAVLLDVSMQGAKGRGAAYPTTRRYERGQVVSWEWNLRNVWGRAWYRDPQSGEIYHAWDSSAEFVGRPIETIA